MYQNTKKIYDLLLKVASSATHGVVDKKYSIAFTCRHKKQVEYSDHSVPPVARTFMDNGIYLEARLSYSGECVHGETVSKYVILDNGVLLQLDDEDYRRVNDIPLITLREFNAIYRLLVGHDLPVVSVEEAESLPEGMTNPFRHDHYRMGTYIDGTDLAVMYAHTAPDELILVNWKSGRRVELDISQLKIPNRIPPAPSI